MEEKIDKDKKLSLAVRRQPTYTSLKIKVFRIKNGTDKELEEIGHADVQVERKSADWCEIIIEPMYRNKGIGSKVVKLMVDYMKDIRVKEVKV